MGQSITEVTKGENMSCNDNYYGNNENYFKVTAREKPVINQRFVAGVQLMKQVVHKWHLPYRQCMENMFWYFLLTITISKRQYQV